LILLAVMPISCVESSLRADIFFNELA